MFYAIVQQITGWTTFDDKFREKARELRRGTVEYLWNHRREMKEVIIAAMDDGSANSLDENSEEYMEVAMKHIKELAKDHTWAGTESVLALKEILNKNIRVFSPYVEPQEYRVGNGQGQTIEIYYNGVNHYNSVFRQPELVEEHREREETIAEQVTKAVEVHQKNEELNMQESRAEGKVDKGRFWMKVKDGRVRARRFVEGPESLLWSVCFQASGITPRSIAFEELPKVLEEEIRKAVNVQTKVIVPNSEVWKAIANITGSQIKIYRENEETAVFYPKSVHTEAKEVIVAETRIRDSVQIDSVEKVYIRTEKENKRKEQTNKQETQQNRENQNKRTSKDTLDQPEKMTTMTIKMASLNVRGCCMKSKREEIDEELYNAGVDIAVLQEANITGVKVDTQNYEWWISDRSNANNMRGLAILKKRGNRIKVRGVRTINKNIMSAIIEKEEGDESWLIINVHAPNANANSFFAALGAYINSHPRKEKMIILGDFNSQIGKEDIDDDDMERLGIHIGHRITNENGDYMKIFLKIHNLNVTSMRFDKSLLYTWTNGSKTSQIDHILLDDNTIVKVKYIKARWTTIQTDHKMLMLGIQAKQWKQENKTVKVKKLLLPKVLQQSEPKQIFHRELQKHEPINVENLEITEAYEKITEKITTSARKALEKVKDPMTPKRKKAIHSLLKARKQARLAKSRGIDTNWFRENINIRRHDYYLAVRDHNEKEIFKFYNELQDYEVGERIKRSYIFLKKFTRRRATKKPLIAMKKWVEELKLTEGESIVIKPDNEELTEEPSREEIRNIIDGLVNGKAAGTDKIRNEYVKYSDEDSIEELYQIIRKVWRTNKMPEQWKKSVQIPIPKKKGAKETTDFRRITLCNLGYKVYAKWLVTRLRQYAGDPGYHQTAFTQDRSTDDQIFFARRCMEENWNAGNTIVLMSADVKKAFDLVDVSSVSTAKINIWGISNTTSIILSFCILYCAFYALLFLTFLPYYEKPASQQSFNERFHKCWLRFFLVGDRSGRVDHVADENGGSSNFPIVFLQGKITH